MNSTSCLACTKIVEEKQQAIACMSCNNWYHVNCVFQNIKVTKTVYEQILGKDNIFWACNSCLKNSPLIQKPVQIGASGNINQYQTVSQATNAVTKHKSSPSPRNGAASSSLGSNARTKPKPANDGWEIVRPKNSFKNKSIPGARPIKIKNRFKLLDIAPTNDRTEGNELKLIGDSIIKGQGSDFNDRRKKKKSSTFCRPGAKLDDITAMVHDINGNQIHDDKELIIHVGTNDMVQPPKANNYRNRAIPQRASESIYGKYKNLVQELRNRNTKSYVVGMLPRFKVTHELNSRILSMNSRVQQLCKEAGIGYIDMFTKFQVNSNLFTSDGLHLSYQGKQLYAEILKFNINNFGN